MKEYFINPKTDRVEVREKQPASEPPVRSKPWLGLWRRAFIVGIISALPVTLLSDRWPWIIAVPIIGGTVWVVWADLRGDRKRPNSVLGDNHPEANRRK